MRQFTLPAILAVLSLAAFLTAPAPAPAETGVVTCTRTVTQPDGSLSCTTPFRWKVSVANNGDRVAVDLTAPATHCGRVRYVIAGRGLPVLGSTGFLSAGQTERLEMGALPRGVHVIDIRADGEVGGCIVDHIASWGVEAVPVLLP